MTCVRNLVPPNRCQKPNMTGKLGSKQNRYLKTGGKLAHQQDRYTTRVRNLRNHWHNAKPLLKTTGYNNPATKTKKWGQQKNATKSLWLAPLPSRVHKT